MAEKPPGGGDWFDRLPGHAGAAVSPAWSTPEGLYQYVVANVPGLSDAEKGQLHAQILGGQPFLANQRGFAGGGVTVVANPGAGNYPSSPADAFVGLTPGEMQRILALPPFAGPDVHPGYQPDVPGGAQFMHVGGPFVPGTPGQPGWQNYVPPTSTTPPPPPPPPPPPVGTTTRPVVDVTHDPTLAHTIGHGVVGTEPEPPPGWFNSTLNGVPVHTGPYEGPPSDPVVVSPARNFGSTGRGRRITRHRRGGSYPVMP